MDMAKNRIPSDDADTRDVEFDERISALIAARETRNEFALRHAEESLILICLPRATAVARTYRRRGVELDDIEQIARLGLIKAVRGWEPRKGGLLGYVMPTIHGEIKRYFRDKGAPIRIPRSLYEARPIVTSIERDLRQRLSREPTVTETAQASGLAESLIRRVRLVGTASRPLSTDDSDWTGEMISEAAELALEGCTLRAVLRPAMGILTARERRIIALRFVWGQSQAQIATALGVSQMHVSRLLSTALAKLRAFLMQQQGLPGAA
jgi:RNA polymerase sigma-B factor